MEIEIIDNFLDKEHFDNLYNLIINNKEFKWTCQQNIEGPEYEEGIFRRNLQNLKPRDEPSNWKYFYFVHLFYLEVPYSKFYDMLFPIFEKIGLNTCIRAKTNLFPNSDILYEHEMHTDYPFSHMGGILCLNSCDGYTKFEDGTKVDSIANRFYTFDGSKKHCSTTTTNVWARININLNFF